MLDAVGKPLHPHTTIDIMRGEVTIEVAKAFQGLLCLLMENLRFTPGFS